ncbi:MAG TPA: 5-oxoprolinase subunit PxpB [Chitinophagaceae bacterium]|nr:5-oxoprolinase subunit PxpB [Chitinophagaceae bacterium]
MPTSPSYKIFFISESAATIDFGNVIDKGINNKTVSLFNHLCRQPLQGMIESIPAYSSLTIYFDPFILKKINPPQKKIHECIGDALKKLMKEEFVDNSPEKNLVRIPVCYEEAFGIDLSWLADQKGISSQEVIRLHTSKEYHVYMLGFLPGFAYMGEVAGQIAVPRKLQPQQIVVGSVGIAGKQTGIYPLNSPGGWQIIGRTPLKMFDINKKDPCLLNSGDQVVFYSISKYEFENYQSGST